MLKKLFKIIKIIMLIILSILILIFLYLISLKPSNERDWAPEQKILPYAIVEGEIAKFYNVRDFQYHGKDDYDIRYYDREYNLNEIISIDYIVVPFGSIGAAHTFLSFGFKNGEYLSISTEIRKEKGEEFSGLKGLFRQFEIMYVVANERDVIRLRTNFRNNNVYLYPAVGKPETHKKILLDIIDRINGLKETPEFYNTLHNNCATSVADHVNTTAEQKINWNLNLFLPKNSDRFAREKGFLNIDPTLSIEEMRKKYYITDKAQNTPIDANFSKSIREQ